MIVTTSSFGFVPGASGINSLPVSGEIGLAGVQEYGDAAIQDAILEGQLFQTNGLLFIVPLGGAVDVGWFDNSSGQYSEYRGVPINASQSVIYVTLQEPSTFALLGLGGVGLLACAWRRTKLATPRPRKWRIRALFLMGGKIFS